MKTQIYNYKKNNISFKKENNIIYLNATEMAKPFKKRPNDYLNLPNTKELIQAITRKSGNGENAIVMQKVGNPEFGGGTWLIEDLAIDFAQWLSIDFRLWVAEKIKELLKNGFTTIHSTQDLIANPDLLIGLATELKKERQENQILQQELQQAQPKVLFADSVSASSTSILVGELAKILKQNGVEIGQNRFFEYLRQNGYLIARNGSDFNMPTQKAMQLKIFEIKETSITHSDGHISVSKTPKITGKGQVYFINKFLNQEQETAGLLQ